VGAELVEGASLFLPLFLGFVAHGVCIRFGILRPLATPLDRGATWRGRRLLGDNKTFRGIVCVATGTAVGFYLLGPPPFRGNGRAFALGLAVGVAAMLAELPNSALKRQVGVAPGAQVRGVRGVAFHVLDQVDVLVGGWLVLSIVVTPTPGRVLGSLLFVYCGHQLITLVGYALGMRATPR
jgi:hypothetical protein